MYHRLICRDVYAAVFLRRGKTEGVIVGVYRAADGAEAVVAVRHHVGHGKFPQSACDGGLNDAYVGYVVGNEAVEFYFQTLSGSAAVRSEYPPAHRFFASGSDVRVLKDRPAVFQKDASVVKLYHFFRLPGSMP